MNQIKQIALIVASLALMQIKAYSREEHPKMDEKTQQAIQACEKENSLSRPEPGRRPTEAERKIIDTCLAKKGFQMPPPHHGKHDLDEGGVDINESKLDGNRQQGQDTSTAQ